VLLQQLNFLKCAYFAVMQQGFYKVASVHLMLLQCLKMGIDPLPDTVLRLIGQWPFATAIKGNA